MKSSLEEETEIITAQILEKANLFSELGSFAIKEIAKYVKFHYYNKGQFIFLAGESHTALITFVEGKAKIIRQSDNYKEVVIGYFYPGDSFGFDYLLNNIPSQVSVITTKPTKVAVINKKDMMAIINKYPQIYNRILSSLATHINVLNKSIEILATCNLEKRIYIALNNLNSHSEHPISVTHQEIADMTGTTRVGATIILNKLKNAKVITYTRGKLVILNRQKIISSANTKEL